MKPSIPERTRPIGQSRKAPPVKLEVINPPTVEPLSLGLVKQHCRVWADLTEEDELIDFYLASARGWLEGVTARALITQTLRETRTVTDGGTVRLLRAPVQEILTVNGESIGLPKLEGEATLTGLPAGSEVIIEYRAGFGDDPEDVPAHTRHALLLIVGLSYEQRTPISSQTVNEVPNYLQNLIARLSWGGELPPC